MSPRAARAVAGTARVDRRWRRAARRAGAWASTPSPGAAATCWPCARRFLSSWPAAGGERDARIRRFPGRIDTRVRGGHARGRHGTVRAAARFGDRSLVPNSSGASYPQFSPDSQWIAFIVAEGLRRVPVSGGAPVTVRSAGTFLGVRGLAWGFGQCLYRLDFPDRADARR